MTTILSALANAISSAFWVEFPVVEHGLLLYLQGFQWRLLNLQKLPSFSAPIFYETASISIYITICSSRDDLVDLLH